MSVRSILAISLLSIGCARAADTCPFIRPPGLTGQQVEGIVLSTYAQALRVDPTKIDTRRTIKSLDGTENAILTYSFATLTLGESLGFDAIKTFFDATKAKGGEQPFETLSLVDLQSSARIAYAEGKDSEPPLATANSTYKVHSLLVRAPQPVDDWRMVRCGGEYVAFRRQSQLGTSTAAVRVAALPPYQSEAQFLELVTTMVSASVPSGYTVRPWKPVAQVVSGAQCMDSSVVAERPSDAQLFFRSRICYASASAAFGYAILFGHHGSDAGESTWSQAEDFIRSIATQ